MIEHREIDGIAILTTPESLDSVNADNFKQIIAEYLSREIYRVVVDLSATEFINSSGLNALVSQLPSVRSGEGDIRLVTTNIMILNQLRVTSLDRVFQCHQTLSDALAGYLS